MKFMGREVGEQFVVRAWKPSCEASFCFGPFGDEDEAERFCDRAAAAGYSDLQIEVLNAPALVGTGQEIA